MPLENLPPGGPDLNIGAIIMAAVLAIWGGTVNFIQRARKGKIPCNLKEYALEMFISLFAGFTVCAIALAFNWSPYLAGAFAGLGGHYGARTIFLLRGLFEKFISSFLTKK